MFKAQQRNYKTLLETIIRLSIAIHYKVEDTGAHIYRISHYCAIIAKGLHLRQNEVEIIPYASPLHDVGIIGIPDKILLKPGKLNDQEWEIIKQHTTIGARILSGSESEILQAGEVIALSHHERWNGSGYPKGLVGEEIPLYGRICAVADVFDALTSERPYRKAFSNEEAYEILRKGYSTQFDPKVVDAFFEGLDEVVEIQEQYSDTEKVLFGSLQLLM
ncbi:MAG: HD domain-containing protein [Deltaproteobacteria bacterium]|nr:HD domain-containing protein [Deltaproteobacteria bacterium]